MSMTREKAIKLLKQYQGYEPMFPDGEKLKHAFDLTDKTVDTLLAALRGPTREMVERMRGMILSDVSGWNGSWSAKCSRCGATIGLGSEGEYDITHKYRFCPMCMSPFTDEAVDMMLERWKEAVGGE